MLKKSTVVRIIQKTAPLASAIVPSLAGRWLERLFLTPIRYTPPAREQDWLVGAARSRIAFEEAREIPLLSWGSGPVVILAHGWSARGSQLGAFVAPLVARGYRVVTFDAPGHGNADGGLTGLPEFATAIERVAERVGPVEAIIAHSLGTKATTLALARGLEVGRVVYVAPPENPREYLDRAGTRLGFGERARHNARERIEQRFGYSFVDGDSERLAPQMRTPLLVIHDRDDRDVPFAEGQRIVERWPGARLRATEGLGHRRILRAPVVVEAATTFVGAARPPHLVALP